MLKLVVQATFKTKKTKQEKVNKIGDAAEVTNTPQHFLKVNLLTGRMVKFYTLFLMVFTLGCLHTEAGTHDAGSGAAVCKGICPGIWMATQGEQAITTTACPSAALSNKCDKYNELSRQQLLVYNNATCTGNNPIGAVPDAGFLIWVYINGTEKVTN
ncbi:MAG: hypothetical protein EBZ77_01095 [Chitinophagia bacterium]|nr:hypothetical protein [Chitinophagia bacterium]